MFVGHYSAAFAAKAAAPRLPLWLLFVAVQAVDIGWALLVMLGVEKLRIVPGITASSPLDLYYMPFTHSLPAAVVWAGAAYVLYRWLSSEHGATGAAARAAAVVALAVASHWVLDLLVHRPDLPLYDDSAKVGLGLWNHPLLSFALETGLLLASVLLCRRAIAAPRALLGFWAALAVLQAIAMFGPGPTSPTGVVTTALLLFIVLAFAAARVERAAVPATAC
jgi:hypothetical protein